MKIEKMKKSASTLYTVFNIMQILVIVAAVILVVAAGLLFTLSGPMEAFTYTSLSFGDVTVRLAPGIEAGGMSKTQIVMILAAAVILRQFFYKIRIHPVQFLIGQLHVIFNLHIGNAEIHQCGADQFRVPGRSMNRIFIPSHR